MASIHRELEIIAIACYESMRNSRKDRTLYAPWHEMETEDREQWRNVAMKMVTETERAAP